MSDELQRALEFEQKQTVIAKKRSNHLFVIGINDYQHQNKLNNARRDAETFRQLMVEKYQVKSNHVYELYDQDATRANILDRFEELSDNLTEKDNLIIYYSGHGIKHKGVGYWIPVESAKTHRDGISNDQINNFLEHTKAHHIYLIIDSCFSGSFIARDVSKTLQLKEAFPSRRVLTSGRNEVVSDGSAGNHSPFFTAIKAYMEHESGPIAAADLEYHVIKNTPRSADQLPLASHIHGTGDQSGQLVMYPKADERSDWHSAISRQQASLYLNFIKDYPNSPKIEEAEWKIAELQDDLERMKAYCLKYPAGSFRSQAIERMNYLEEKDAFERASQRGQGALLEYIDRYSPDGSFIAQAKELLTRPKERPSSSAYSSSSTASTKKEQTSRPKQEETTQAYSQSRPQSPPRSDSQAKTESPKKATSLKDFVPTGNYIEDTKERWRLAPLWAKVVLIVGVIIVILMSLEEEFAEEPLPQQDPYYNQPSQYDPYGY
ncbi:MAG: caspase family protein [Bacteroidota bacterium]